jgi:hypothetical protein
MKRTDRPPRMRLARGLAVLALVVSAWARGDDAPVATITVTSATAGSSLGGKLVEGVMHYRDRDYLLTLHGVARSVTTRGTVYSLPTAREIEGIYRSGAKGLQNKSGVTIRFDPPLALESDQLEIELSAGMQPKVSRGQRGSGVE